MERGLVTNVSGLLYIDVYMYLKQNAEWPFQLIGFLRVWVPWFIGVAKSIKAGSWVEIDRIEISPGIDNWRLTTHRKAPWYHVHLICNPGWESNGSQLLILLC